MNLLRQVRVLHPYTSRSNSYNPAFIPVSLANSNFQLKNQLGKWDLQIKLANLSKIAKTRGLVYSNIHESQYICTSTKMRIHRQ